MPIEFGLWRIDNNDFRRLSASKLTDESRLERLLIEDPNLLGRRLLIVGQQVHTASGNRLDLLGIDVEGNLHIIELKRDRTPRDVVAQALDYAAWVRTLTYDDIVNLYNEFSDDRSSKQRSLSSSVIVDRTGHQIFRKTSIRATVLRSSPANSMQQRNALSNIWPRSTTYQ